MLTLPVWLYFTLCEMMGRQATLGKIVVKLEVVGGPAQVVTRNILKFAPWEIAHTGIWHGMEVPFGSAPNTLGWALFAASIGLSSLYVVSLFIGRGRPLYDLLSGTRVVRQFNETER